MDDFLFFLSGVAIGVSFKDAILKASIRAVDAAINAYVDAGLPVPNLSSASVKQHAVHEKYREYSINDKVFYRICKPVEFLLQDYYVSLKYIRIKGIADEEQLLPIIRRAAGFNGDFHGYPPRLKELAEVFGLDLDEVEKIIVVNDNEQEIVIT